MSSGCWDRSIRSNSSPGNSAHHFSHISRGPNPDALTLTYPNELTTRPPIRGASGAASATATKSAGIGRHIGDQGSSVKSGWSEGKTNKEPQLRSSTLPPPSISKIVVELHSCSGKRKCSNRRATVNSAGCHSPSPIQDDGVFNSHTGLETC
jgi:hypothetical protein